jgi:hypothetical protein
MPTDWNVCEPLLIPPEDVAELKRLASIDHKGFLKTDLWEPIAKVMRAQCPVQGDNWKFLATVWNPVGAEIPEHKHNSHTMLFYPEACDPVVIEGVPFHPERGDIVHLSPHTLHAVPPTARDRVTVAMLVKDANHTAPE